MSAELAKSGHADVTRRYTNVCKAGNTREICIEDLHTHPQSLILAEDEWTLNCRQKPSSIHVDPQNQ